MMTINEQAAMEMGRMIDDLVEVMGRLPEERSGQDLVEAAKSDKLACVKLAIQKMPLPCGMNFPVTIKLVEVPFLNSGLPGKQAAASIELPSTVYKRDRFEIKVCTGCFENHVMFVRALLHELSHLYLKICGSAHFLSEKHTDLCAMVMGYTDVVSAGLRQGLGYLTGAEFEAAAGYLKLKRCEQKKSLDVLKNLEAAILNVKRIADEIRTHLSEVYRNTPRMSFNDAARLPMFFSEVLPNTELALDRLNGRYSKLKEYTKSILSAENSQFAEEVQSAKNDAKQLAFKLTHELSFLDGLRNGCADAA